MKIIIDQLRDYIDLPPSAVAIHELMEDIGLEVKRADKVGERTVFNLELLANRGDHHSYKGVAREIHGRTGWPLHHAISERLPKVADHLIADIQTANCLNYAIAEFKRNSEVDHVAGLSEGQAEMVVLSGNQIGVPVSDISGFVSIEMGQPLFAFDADKVQGRISVRESSAGERAHLVGADNDVELPVGTIIIADEKQILAVAGVKNCVSAQPTAETERVYIESATYDPVKVRKAAKALNVQSTASARFERGADVALVDASLERVAALLGRAGWSNDGGLRVAREFDYIPVGLSFNIRNVNDYFETAFTSEDISSLLSRYGFEVAPGHSDDLNVTVPSARMWDIKSAEDLYEEIAKGIGYNSLPSSMPKAAGGVLPSSALQRKGSVADMLVGQGFYEVFTDGFYSEEHRENTGIREGHPLWEHVKIANAGDRSFALLKNNTVAQATELVRTNLNFRNSNIKAFEWTRTFHPDAEAENGLCEERLVLWAIAAGESRQAAWDEAGKKVDVFYMKGIVEEISAVLGIQLKIRQVIENADTSPEGLCLHPTRRGAIYWNDKMVGVVGELHPEVIEGWGLNKNSRPCFIELSQEILDVAPSARKYSPPSSLHPVMRDVCLLLPSGVAAAEIADSMKEFSPWLSEVAVRDVFNSEATNNRNAVTFSLRYSHERAGRGNFTADDVNIETENVVTRVLEKYASHSLERR